MATNYLTERLSDELLVHILGYIRTHDDLVRIAETCPRLNQLLRDKAFASEMTFPWHSHLQRAHFTRFLKDRPRAELVTRLDFSDLYWIPSGILRDLILNMVNLETLLAAGTPLSWTHLSQLLKSLPVLSKLSWSWDNNLEESCRRRSSNSPAKFIELTEMKQDFLKLRSLLIHIPMMCKVPTDVLFYSYSALEHLVAQCTNLEELWFLSWPKTAAERKSSSSSCRSRRDLEDRGLIFPNLHTLVISVKGPPRFSPMSFFNKLVRQFGVVKNPDCFWMDHPLLGIRSMYSHNEEEFGLGQVLYNAWTPQMCSESATRLSYPLMAVNDNVKSNFKYPKLKDVLISHGQPVVVGLNGILDNSPELQSFSCSTFNLRMDWNKFVLLHPKLKSICMTEAQGMGMSDDSVAFSKLDLLENLSVSIECLYEIRDSKVLSDYLASQLTKDEPVEEKTEDNKSVMKDPLLKKRRIGVKTNAKSLATEQVSGLHLIANGCPKIVELEIGYGGTNNTRAGRILMDSLFCISSMKLLRKLSLSSLPIINGKFLIEICRSVRLETLRLTHLGPAAKCCYVQDLCKALSYCKDLKDFRFEQNYMGSPSPLLIALQECPNLQRILLWSSPNDRALEFSCVDALFSKCPNLLMFYATIETTTKQDCFKMRKVLEAKYKPLRPALSIVLRRTLEEEEIINYPSIHYRQMVVNAPQVCQFNDFAQFNIVN